MHLDADTRDLLDGLRQDVYSKKMFKKGCVWSLQKQDFTADYTDIESLISSRESVDLSEIYEDFENDGVLDLSPWDEVEEVDLMPVEIFNLYYNGGGCHV